MKPLTGLVNESNKAINTAATRETFHKLLVAVDNQLSLRHLRYDLPIVVYTDASLRGLGGILVNVYPDGSEWVVDLVSHCFTDEKSRWKTIEQKAFGVVIGMRYCGASNFF